MAIVYGTNMIVVDRKQGCFSGMKRSVSGLVGRQEVECRTVGSVAPSDDTFNELGYVVWIWTVLTTLIKMMYIRHVIHYKGLGFVLCIIKN